jgi:hypothetical protein
MTVEDRPEPRYVLNVNDGIDTMHRDPGEQCNTDDAEGKKLVDAKTALSMVLNGHAVRCQHCFADEP